MSTFKPTTLLDKIFEGGIMLKLSLAPVSCFSGSMIFITSGATTLSTHRLAISIV